jgi:hypothetical protein
VSDSPETQALTSGEALHWLLDSDPAIRWQVIRDLTDAPEEEVAAERARVAVEGWGAQLLSLQGKDGRGEADAGNASDEGLGDR